MRSPRPLASLLTALAILAQACLPLLHAQNWASANNSNLLFAFCGEISPALLAKARAIAPAGLAPSTAATPSAQDCPLCLLVHALSGALALAAVAVLLLAPVRSAPGAHRRAAPCSRRQRRYLARGPPEPSLLHKL